MGQNGHNGFPRALGGTADVPIVGQPFALKKWLMTVLVTCNCGAHEPVLIVGHLGAKGVCPACKRIFMVRGFKTNGPRVDWDFVIGMLTPDGVAEEAPADAPLG